MTRNSLKCTLERLSGCDGRFKENIPIRREAEALMELDNFARNWDEKYPQISQSWRNHWPMVDYAFNFPADIRKVIYTTNAIESLNSVIRKAVKTRKLFPSDESATRLYFSLYRLLLKKWTMPIRN